MGLLIACSLAMPADAARAADSDFGHTQHLAEQGNAGAQTLLGVMYDNGNGVTQNYTKAHMWVNIAASSGFTKAGKARDIVATKMTPKQIAEAQKMAAEWKPQ